MSFKEKIIEKRKKQKNVKEVNKLFRISQYKTTTKEANITQHEPSDNVDRFQAVWDAHAIAMDVTDQINQKYFDDWRERADKVYKIVRDDNAPKGSPPKIIYVEQNL